MTSYIIDNQLYDPITPFFSVFAIMLYRNIYIYNYTSLQTGYNANVNMCVVLIVYKYKVFEVIYNITI